MRYSDYIKTVHFKHKSISYNLLTKKGSVNQKIKVSGQQAYNLIKPYCSTRILEQMAINFSVIFDIISIFCFTISGSRLLSTTWRFGSCHYRPGSIYGRFKYWTDAFWNNYR